MVDEYFPIMFMLRGLALSIVSLSAKPHSFPPD
jgi:hypothetical protein